MLARSPTRSQGVSSENRNAPATMMTATMSHAVVLMAIGCGSGGGAPVGRRWRCVRWTAEPSGLSAAVVRSVFSLKADPDSPGSAPARAASRRRPGAGPVP